MLRAGCFPDKTTRDRRICVSLISYNRLDLTRRCLDMLYGSIDDFDLIVTDNASMDGSRAFLESYLQSKPNATLVLNQENQGYKDPHNNAFRLATANPETSPDFFCALNNDVEMQPGWWPMVLEAFDESANVAIVGNSEHVCSRLQENFDGRPAGPGEEPEYVEGSLFVIRTDIGKKFGMFSPHLDFIYGEDSDLSLRVREAGYAIRLVPLPCRHLQSQTVRRLDKFTAAKIQECKRRNHQYLRKRWAVYLRQRNFRYQVLVRRKFAIGDVLYATPVIRAIQEKWPYAEIFVQTDFPQVFANNPYVKAAAQAFDRQFDFTYDLDLGYERRPLVHPVKAYADICEVECDTEKARVEIFPSSADIQSARSLFSRLPEDRWIAMHVGPTNWPGRDWPRSRWEALMDRMIRDGWKIVLIGSGAWRFNKPILDLQGRTSLQSLYFLLKCVDLFVGLDSGPSHIAQAAGCPAVLLFGTILPEYRLMRQSPVIAVQADPKKVPCVGEHHRLPPPVTYSACNGACMEAITVSMVQSAIEKLT